MVAKFPLMLDGIDGDWHPGDVGTSSLNLDVFAIDDRHSFTEN